jgi:hypothetical protein
MSKFKSFLVVLLTGFLFFPGWTQELGAFEESFQTEREKEEREISDNGDETDEEASFFAELMARLIWYGILGGGVTSQERMHSRDPEFPWPRKKGEPLIALSRSDTAIQLVQADLYALDERFEAGYGAFGATGRYTLFFETDTPAKIHLWSAHLLYRMSIADVMEISPGLGVFGMTGENSYQGFSLTLPVRINIDRRFSCEFISAVNFYPSGAVGSDFEGALLLDWEGICPRIGWRSYGSSGGGYLQGFFAGLTLVS